MVISRIQSSLSDRGARSSTRGRLISLPPATETSGPVSDPPYFLRREKAIRHHFFLFADRQWLPDNFFGPRMDPPILIAAEAGTYDTHQNAGS
jgi:hypothetical protein